VSEVAVDDASEADEVPSEVGVFSEVGVDASSSSSSLRLADNGNVLCRISSSSNATVHSFSLFARAVTSLNGGKNLGKLANTSLIRFRILSFPESTLVGETYRLERFEG
jgi:hypothetical protein